MVGLALAPAAADPVATRRATDKAADSLAAADAADMAADSLAAKTMSILLSVLDSKE